MWCSHLLDSWLLQLSSLSGTRWHRTFSQCLAHSTVVSLHFPQWHGEEKIPQPIHQWTFASVSPSGHHTFCTKIQVLAADQRCHYSHWTVFDNLYYSSGLIWTLIHGMVWFPFGGWVSESVGGWVKWRNCDMYVYIYYIYIYIYIYIYFFFAFNGL